MSNDIIVSKTLVGQADDLAVAHEHFTTHYVVAGRLALYDLLGQMLDLVNKFEAAIDREDLIANVKHRLRSEFGIKTQRNSSDTAVLIRYMTRADRKTAHVYTRVLESAKQSGVSPAQLPAFIEGAGGIERIRALSSNQPKASNKNGTDEFTALTEEYLGYRKVLPLTSFDATEFLDQVTSGDTKYAYFICTRKLDGKFYVLAPIPATHEFERTAIDRLSSFICEDMEQAKEGVLSLRKAANIASIEEFGGAEVLETANRGQHI